MKREELIAYDKWLTENKWGSCEIVTPEQAADLYLAEHPLPPAGGAEEFILSKIADFKLQDCYPTFVPEMAQVMTEFAALHAQRLAEKMVEEKMREDNYGRKNYSKK